MYGLLGKKLGHSFSKIIHEEVTGKPYNLIEVDNLDQFFKHETFKGLNVTIPYKNDVIKYLDELSTISKATDSVNTIYFKSGKLIGTNTDYYGLEKALSYNDISVMNQEVIIMGNGSTSRTIKYYCEQNLAKKITILARNPRESEYHFSDVDNFKSANIIFNATPLGMFPNNNQELPFVLSLFDNLDSVIDVVYNPLRSNLLMEAESLHKKTVNGLYMLISQAIKSIEIFHNITISDDKLISIYKKLSLQLKNLVFIGMPMAGKSLYTRLCSEYFNKEAIDTDQYIEQEVNMDIPSIFQTHGEKGFRTIETSIIEKVSKLNNKAISCGGGVILNKLNVSMLKQNGIIIFIDVPLSILKQCNPKDRPLLKDPKNLDKLYNARYELYKQNADIIINKSTFDIKVIMEQIEVKLNEYISA